MGRVGSSRPAWPPECFSGEPARLLSWRTCWHCLLIVGMHGLKARKGLGQAPASRHQPPGTSLQTPASRHQPPDTSLQPLFPAPSSLSLTPPHMLLGWVASAGVYQAEGGYRCVGVAVGAQVRLRRTERRGRHRMRSGGSAHAMGDLRRPCWGRCSRRCRTRWWQARGLSKRCVDRMRCQLMGCTALYVMISRQYQPLGDSQGV